MGNQYYVSDDSAAHLSLKFWVVVFLLCLFLGFCMFFAKKSYTSDENNVKELEELGANISINYDNNSNLFVLEDFTPTKDYLGKSSGVNKCFDFSVDVHLKQAKEIEYEISVKKGDNSNIDDKYIRVYLEKMSVFSGHYESVFEPASFTALSSTSDVGTPKGNMLLHSDSATETRQDHYRLRMWVIDGGVVGLGNYELEVSLNAIAK